MYVRVHQSIAVTTSLSEVRLPVDETGEADSAVPDRAQAGRLQVRLPPMRLHCRFAAVHPLEAGARKWVDDLKESATAFWDWGCLLTIVGFIMAGSPVVIAVELFVICLKV